MNHYYCRVKKNQDACIQHNIAIPVNLSAITNQWYGIEQEDLNRGSFYIKPSLFKFLGKKNKLVLIEQNRNLSIVEIHFTDEYNLSGGFNLFSKFKISDGLKIEAWSISQSGSLHLLVENLNDTDTFNFLIKTQNVLFAFEFLISNLNNLSPALVATKWFNTNNFFFDSIEPESAIYLDESGLMDNSPEVVKRRKNQKKWKKNQRR